MSSMKIRRLADGRKIGYSIIEIIEFPAMDSFNSNEGDVLAQNATAFCQCIQEFCKIGKSLNTCAELLWIAEPVEKQVTVSRIRVFLVLRRIGRDDIEVQKELEELRTHFITLLELRQYSYKDITVYDEFVHLLSDADTECCYALVKNETVLLPQLYYSCDILPGNNTDNFNAFIASLSQSTSCCVSFQLFPTAFDGGEANLIRNQAVALTRVTNGYFNGRQVVRDESAANSQITMMYYDRNINSSLFQYNILIFGGHNVCRSITAKTRSLLGAGKEKITTADCCCVDLSGANINLVSQFANYPWNINKIIISCYRNKQIRTILNNSLIPRRMPYLMTAQEAAAFFRLPIYEMNMHGIKGKRLFLTAEDFDEMVTNKNNLQMGRLVGAEEVVIGCPASAFTKHALIVGMPGSGKTTFSINLLLQFAEKGIPFLAIEPTKTEYRAMVDAVPNIQVFTPGNQYISPFIINPFLPPNGIRLEQYTPSLLSAFAAAFSMPSPLDVLFQKAIRTCYTEYGWKDYSKAGDDDVQVFGLHEFICCFREIIESSSYSNEVKGNLTSAGIFRLMNLIEQNSNIYDNVNTVPIEDLLVRPTVLELNAIDNAEQKSLLMALLLINICLYTKHTTQSNGALKNIILIDEAHVLLAGDTGREKADACSTTVKALQNMIAEIRAFGTGIIIADQSPTKVSREVVANTDIKVAFRLVQADEKRIIADSTNMNEKTMLQLSTLKPGKAYVYYSHLELPQCILTDDIRANRGVRLTVSDEEIREDMHYWDGKKKKLRPYVECNACEMCQNDCDFRIRSQADYYVQELFRKNAAKITNEEVLMKYVNSMGKLIETRTQGLPEKEKRRIEDCCRIKLVRKMQLETKIYLPRRMLIMNLKNRQKILIDEI